MNPHNLAEWLTHHSIEVFYAMLIMALLINRLPFIGVFFRTVNTLLHESGHAIAALITNGEVVRIELKKDTSGIAETKSRGRFGAFITSFTGYPFAAAVSSFLLVLVLNNQYRIAAFILLSFAVLNLLLFVRNAFGVIWLLMFSVMLTGVVWYSNDVLLKMIVTLVVLISYTESITSTLIITLIGITNPRKSGDMANMQKSTGIHAGFWTLINLIVVTWLMYYTVIHYFPSIKLIFT